jgi:hypothetical protein
MDFLYLQPNIQMNIRTLMNTTMGFAAFKDYYLVLLSCEDSNKDVWRTISINYIILFLVKTIKSQYTTNFGLCINFT